MPSITFNVKQRDLNTKTIRVL
uniref:Uncharacterized protein n=1 Tax=Rhizophora mucronata TaxID=61149 RepID=A0A2P2PAT3_RHIMU